MKEYDKLLNSTLCDMIIHIAKRPSLYREDIVLRSEIYDWHERLTALSKDVLSLPAMDYLEMCDNMQHVFNEKKALMKGFSEISPDLREEILNNISQMEGLFGLIERKAEIKKKLSYIQ